jgi:hypothetical protein
LAKNREKRKIMPRGQKKNKPGNINLLGIAGKKYKIIKKKKEL